MTLSMDGNGGTLMQALALVLVIEGLLPLFSPLSCRGACRMLTELSDGQLRFMGLLSLLSGLFMVYILK